jgi:hypothetical protein
MRFEVRPGDQPSFDSSSVERSEISSRKEIEFGKTYTLSYKFMVEPGQALAADWMILGQVHHRNDAGESGGSPPFAIEVNDGVMRVIYRTSTEKIRTSNPSPKTLWKDDGQIERGHWYDVKAEIKFDPFGNGLVNMWVDGQQIISYKGALGYNDDDGGYLKMGVYRRASSETVAVKYDNIQMVEGTTSKVTPALAPSALTTSMDSNFTVPSVPSAETTADGRPATMVTKTGTSSSNSLTGTSSNDKISGKGGNDKIWGKKGSDLIITGSGKDAIIFDTCLGPKNVDYIVDFNPAYDTLYLENSIFTKLTDTNKVLRPSLFRVGEKALESNDYIVYNKATGDLYYDKDGSGSGAAIKFAHLENKPTLMFTDFVII